MHLPVVAGAALFGLLVGSFLNVVVWRVPRGESIVSPPSHCPSCDRQIGARDNVPISAGCYCEHDAAIAVLISLRGIRWSSS